VEADATQVRQIVMNLITNASDALEERAGVISISTGTTRVDRDYLAGAQVGADCPEGRYAFLEVADTGVGMSPETVSRIFEPFFTTKFTGRGLGLAATLGIVRGHRGALKVYSEPGQGSTFKLLLPVAEASPEPPVISAASLGPAVRAGTLLVVDDEPAIRAVARRILESASFGVLEAVDGREAVRMIREHGPRIHLILLDLTMPELSGEEAFREIRKLDGEVAVLLSSGYNEQETVVRFAGKGLTGFIQKPYSAQELLAAVRRALAGRKGPAEPDVRTP
jgi:CheY-like chemotaxis protein